MRVKYVNPGFDYMIKSITAFQGEDESSFWSESLFHFYPQLDKSAFQGSRKTRRNTLKTHCVLFTEILRVR